MATGYTAETWGEKWAEQFDMDPAPWGADPGDTDEAVEYLVGLAAGGPVLELGVGTGRVAIPLAQKGLEVHGLDVSGEMLNRLAKAQGADAPVVGHLGNMSDVNTGSADAYFKLIFCAFDSFSMLLSLEDQKKCIANCARALQPGGRLVIQASPPAPELYMRPVSVDPFELGLDRVQLLAGAWNASRQIHKLTFLMVRDGRVSTYPVQLRYAWTSELDLMAELAGLSLEYRSEQWKKELRDVTQGRIVSAWRKL